MAAAASQFCFLLFNLGFAHESLFLQEKYPTLTLEGAELEEVLLETVRLQEQEDLDPMPPPIFQVPSALPDVWRSLIYGC